MRKTLAPWVSMAVAATVVAASVRGEQPAGDELINPEASRATAPSPPQLKLPANKPKIELASFWRRAKPVLQAAVPQENLQGDSQANSNARPPEPAPLAQPAWLVPEVITLEHTEPVEPSGEAVVIDDSKTGPSINEVIELAMANLELAPPRSTALLVVARELAVEATTVGDFGDVITQCHRALDAGPDGPTATALGNLAAWAYNRRGELLANTDDEHAAFEDFQEALRLNEYCWPALHNRGVTLARYGKQTEALADFNRVVDLAPDFAVARYNRGEVLSQMERWHEAVDDYTVALKSMPSEAALHAARGYARQQLGQTAEAATDFNTAIRLDDTAAEAYVGRGNLFAAERLYEQAASDFQQALRLDPNSPTAYRSVAWLLSTCPMQQFRSAEKGVESAHRVEGILGNQNPMVLDTLAVAYANAGDFRQAIAYEQQAMVLANEEDRKIYEHRLELYRNGKPFRTE